MIGKLLGAAASTVVRAANLPARAADRALDYAMGEEDSEDPGGPRVSSAGETLADEIEDLLSSIDGRS